DHTVRHLASICCVWSLAVLVGCTNTSSTTATAVGKPACTLLCEINGNAGSTSVVMVSERVDPTVGSGFAPFRAMAGPLGNPAVASNIYAVREAWLRRDVPIVFRAQATTPLSPQNSNGWNVDAQTPTGWLGAFGFGFSGGRAETGSVAASAT